jgi:hypothetical protein
MRTSDPFSLDQRLLYHSDNNKLLLLRQVITNAALTAVASQKKFISEEFIIQFERPPDCVTHHFFRAYHPQLPLQLHNPFIQKLGNRTNMQPTQSYLAAHY